MRKRIFGFIAGIIAASAVVMPIAGHIATECVQAAQTGWVYDTKSKAYKYYDNSGRAYTGWHWMTAKEGEKTDHWSYFGDDGVIRTGWVQLGKGTSNPDGNAEKHWSYFGSNGWLRTGWVQLGKGTAEPDGNSAKHWSYFGENGWLREGWQQMGKGTNNPDGNTEKHWSYFGANGWLRTGWVQLGKGTAEPDENSAKHWSYFGANGWLRTGWVQLGKGTAEPDGNTAKHWSYFGSDGWLRKGLQTMGKGTVNPDGDAPRHSSYFDGKGWLITNQEVVFGEKKYIADSRGWLTETKVEKEVSEASTASNTVDKPKETDKSKTGNTTKTEIFTVTFTDGFGKTICTKNVEKGKKATAPANPVKEGYTFRGWDKVFNNVTGNIIVNALWDVHKHDWKPVYKTIHHDELAYKETYEEPYSYKTIKNGYEAYASISGLYLYRMSFDDFEKLNLDSFWDVPFFELQDKLESDLRQLHRSFNQLYKVNDELFDKLADHPYYSTIDGSQVGGTPEIARDYLYSTVEKMHEYTSMIRNDIKNLKANGGITDEYMSVLNIFETRMDTITAVYTKIYNAGNPDPDKDGKRGYNNYTSLEGTIDIFSDTEFYETFKKVVGTGNIMPGLGWVSGVVVERPTYTGYGSVIRNVVLQPAYDEKITDHYECSCGSTKAGEPRKSNPPSIVKTTTKDTPVSDPVKVTFKNNGEVIKTIEVEKGKAAPVFTLPSRENVYFGGWDVDLTCVNQDITANALWKEYKGCLYKVTFKDGNKVLDEQWVLYNDLPVTPETPVKEGYTFIGWDDDFPDKRPFNNNSRVIQAKWKKNSEF